MTDRKKREYSPSPIEQAGQRNWNECWGSHRDRARWSFVIAVGALGVAGITELRSWMRDDEPKMIPWVIDRNGPSVMVAKLEAKMPDAARIKGHLTSWVSGMRTVSSDSLLQKHLIDQTYAWTDQKTIGQEQLSAWYIANNPAVRREKETVDIDVTSVVPEGGGDSWLVDWTETAYARQLGKIPQISYWRMSVVIHVRLPENEEEIRANWDGVFMQNMHILPLANKAGA